MTGPGESPRDAQARTLMGTAARRLRDAGVPDPDRDAELLLLHVLGLDRAALHARPERDVPAEAADRYRDLVRRRAAREPLQYLTGVQEFWSLPFRVTPAVLIPRPETEGILEALLALPLPRGVARPRILDLGTGSGCLAIAAAHALPDARVVATDVSAEALAVAGGNARELGVDDRVRFVRGDLGDALPAGEPSRFDAILSNPPYIAEADLAGLAPEVRDHEPRVALTPGPDGLAVHRRILAEAAGLLEPGGWLLVEIGAGQAESIRALYDAQDRLQLESIRPDLAGTPRVVVARARAAPSRPA
ncbi:MAG TPA: peptide chain release factor N(5)-glutamine methyltransferase [Candidatus Polarisedimenticolia bacterium]|nr:peptide chain release factor N(5)-glutamine methyltransferase [Candidatus Polarisedimenticolia bacterium]